MPIPTLTCDCGKELSPSRPIKANVDSGVNVKTRHLLASLLGEATTADVVPPFVMPAFKIKALKARGEDGDDDDDDDKPITDGLGATVCPKCGSNKFHFKREPVRMECDECGHVSNRKSESLSTRSLVDSLIEDCPCNIIPDTATPTDGTESTAKKPDDIEDQEAPPSDDAIQVVLGQTPDSEPVETPKVESREDVMHRMVYLTKPAYQKRISEAHTEKVVQTQKAINENKTAVPVSTSTASILHSIGASAPTAAMPSGKDEDAERILQEGAEPVANLSNVVASAGQGGTPMPEHKAGDGKAVLGAFRKFVKG